MSHLTLADLKEKGLKLLKEEAQELHSLISQIAQYADEGFNIVFYPKPEPCPEDEDAPAEIPAEKPVKKAKAVAEKPAEEPAKAQSAQEAAAEPPAENKA